MPSPRAGRNGCRRAPRCRPPASGRGYGRSHDAAPVLPSPGRVDTGLCEYCLCVFGGDVADGGVDPLTIVVALDVGEQVTARGITIGVFALVDELGFQGAEEALHRRVVPAVSLAAHRLGDGGGLEDIAVVTGGVLTAAVGMMDEARSWAPPLDRHGERSDGELGAHVVAHGPADHLAGKQIEDPPRVGPPPAG